MKKSLITLCFAVLCVAIYAAESFTFISPVGAWNEQKSRRDEGAAAFSKTMRNIKDVKKVEALVSALGCFEIYVNNALVSVEEDGNRVDFLRPGVADKNKRRYFLRYDLTDMWRKRKGTENIISAFVGRSWFTDHLGGRRDVKPAIGAKIKLTYRDGSYETIETDTSWNGSFKTPFVRSGIYWGEIRDARVEQNAAVCAGKNACEINTSFKGEVSPLLDGARVSLRNDLALKPVKAYVYSRIAGASSNAFGRIVVDRTWDGKSALKLASGEKLVIDFGQNTAAIPSIVASALVGTELIFKGAEMLNDRNGEMSRGNDGPGGSIYRAMYRALKDDGALVKYVFRGHGKECYRPTFSFMGYQYAEIAVSSDATIHSIVSIPVTSITKSMQCGKIITGNKNVNKLISAIEWSLLANSLSIPTDCPQRDERLGWTGDAQRIMPSVFRLADATQFAQKYATDMRDVQDKRGRYPAMAPTQRGHVWGFGRLGWADAGVRVPYDTWRMSGDTSIIDDNWNAMRKFVDMQAATSNKTALVCDRIFQNADHLAIEQVERDKSVREHYRRLEYWDYLAGCHWLGNARRMAEMAAVTGREKERCKYAAMADEAARYLKATYFTDNGRLPPYLRCLQTAQLFALKMGLYSTPALMKEGAAELAKNIAEHDGALQTGSLGTTYLMDALSGPACRADVAYSLLLRREFPSWLYWIDQGATSLWERWNGYTIEKGFGDARMNSYNHIHLGGVYDWLYGTAAGIKPGSQGGFDERFILAPIPDERLGSLKAEFKTKRGKIVSEWKYENGKCHWRFNIPKGSVAAVVVNGETKEYAAGKYEIEIRD